MKKQRLSKLASIFGCASGLFCAFFTGMFLAAGSLYSLPALFMGISTLVFIVSILSYILLSH